jgi:hypothetical protein
LVHQGPQLVVRTDGLWTFLTSIAPNKIIMATRMRLYEVRLGARDLS